MEEKKNKQIPFTELEKFFKSYVPQDVEVKISPAETITGQRKFIESHLDALRANPGNRRLMPLYERLVKFYNIVKTTKNGTK